MLAVARIWSARQWLQPRPYTAILLISENSHEGREMKKSFSLLIVLSLLGLAGCNTVKGMGQDLQKAGESIEGVVKKK